MSMSRDYDVVARQERQAKPPKPSRSLPKPLVHFKARPLKFVLNLSIMVAVALVFAHLGTLIVTGLYYLLTQTNHTIKHAWDHLFNTSWWPYWRHLIRNVGEGVLGGTLAQLIAFNIYKKRNLKTKLHVFDRLEIKLHIPNLKSTRRPTAKQYVAFPFLIIIYALPGFLIGALAVSFIGHGITHTENLLAPVTHPDTWQRIRTIWTGDVAQKLVGLFASVFMARRVGKQYYNDIQLRFVDRRIALGKGLAFYHPPNFRGRYNDLSRSALTSKARHGSGSGLIPAFLSVGIIVGLGLAVVGYIVLTYIAQ